MTASDATLTWDNVYASGRAVRTWPSEDVVRFVARRLQTPGARVLDVGCGNGANLWFLTTMRHQTIGVDASQVALEQALMLCRLRDPTGFDWITFRPGHMGALADIDVVRTGPFDAIIDCRASQHVAWSAHEAVYREYATMLKPGGWLFLLHLEARTSDAALNDATRLPARFIMSRSDPDVPAATTAEPYTWARIATGVYPDNGLVCMPPLLSLKDCVSRAGFDVDRCELLTRYTWHDGLTTSHVAIDGQRRA